jgi:hypothetical protein
MQFKYHFNAIFNYLAQSRWSGNPTGLSGPLKGGLILEYLATRWNFT